MKFLTRPFCRAIHGQVHLVSMHLVSPVTAADLYGFGADQRQPETGVPGVLFPMSSSALISLKSFKKSGANGRSLGFVSGRFGHKQEHTLFSPVFLAPVTSAPPR